MEVDLEDFDPNKASRMVLEHELKKHNIDFAASSPKKQLVKLFRQLQENTKSGKSPSSEKKKAVKEEDEDGEKKSRSKRYKTTIC